MAVLSLCDNFISPQLLRLFHTPVKRLEFSMIGADYRSVAALLTINLSRRMDLIPLGNALLLRVALNPFDRDEVNSGKLARAHCRNILIPLYT